MIGLIDDLASMRDHERAPVGAMDDRGGDDGLAAAGGRNDENLALAALDQTLELAHHVDLILPQAPSRKLRLHDVIEAI
jgi:hypothetical protein